MAGVGYFKSAHYSQIVQMKYKSKYEKLKTRIKDLVFENAALCDQISETQENIVLIKQERKYLLQRFIEYDHDPDVEKLRKHVLQQPPPNADGTPSHKGKRGPKKRLNPDGTAVQKPNKLTKKVKQEPQPAVQIKITLDSNGNPVYPIKCGDLTIHSVGEIVQDNKNFHTDKWIYPIGYWATRIYSHPREAKKKCTFTCKILNNDGTPQFQIIPDDDFDQVFFGESANICHIGLLDVIVRFAEVKNLPIQAKGELFFGLGSAIVQQILENDPNFTKLENFKAFCESEYENSNDPTLNYAALQKLLTTTYLNMVVPEIKEELPDELLE